MQLLLLKPINPIDTTILIRLLQYYCSYYLIHRVFLYLRLLTCRDTNRDTPRPLRPARASSCNRGSDRQGPLPLAAAHLHCPVGGAKWANGKGGPRRLFGYRPRPPGARHRAPLPGDPCSGRGNCKPFMLFIIGGLLSHTLSGPSPRA